MKNRFLYFILLFFFIISFANAQTGKKDKTKIPKDSLLNKITNIDQRLQTISTADTSISVSSIPKNLYDSLQMYTDSGRLYQLRDENGMLIPPKDNWTPFDRDITFLDTTIVEPAFLPVVFDGKILPDNLDFLSYNKRQDTNIVQFHLIAPENTFAPQLEHINKIDSLRREYYMNNPRRVRYNAFSFENIPVIEEEVVQKKNPFQELISTEKPIDITIPELEKIGIRQVFWTKNGEHNLQLSTEKFSDTWGSDDNFSLNNYHKFLFNYKKKKISWKNTIEWRLNIIRTSSKGDDIKHKERVTDDFLRTYSTFGIDAYKNWSYSSNIEIKTPLFNKFNANDDNKTRAIFSPLEINAGIGLSYNKEVSYKTNKYKKFKFSADISLLSISHKYVADGLVDPTQFGIEEGDIRITDYGSTFNMNLTYSHNRFTSFTSRLKYFTSYKKVQVEFENKLDFRLNNFFATTLYFYGKFNDDIDPSKKDEKLDYFSYNYRVSFGLSYTW